MNAKMFFSSDWLNVVYEGRNEVVFANRNKDYGAYEIRRNYSRYLFNALLISICAVALSVAVPVLVNLISASADEFSVPRDVVINFEPPPLDKNEPEPPPPPPPEQPVMEQLKFTLPIVTEEEVPEEEIPPTEEQLVETNVGEKTQEGDPDALIIAEEGTGVIEDNTVYDLVAIQEQPSFPGGDAEMLRFLTNNIKYPQQEKEMNISGKVFITFVIDKDGSVTETEVYKSLKGGPNCDREAMRVVKMMPKWSPGKQNGKPVKVRYILPIHFKLQ